MKSLCKKAPVTLDDKSNIIYEASKAYDADEKKTVDDTYKHICKNCYVCDEPKE